MDNWPRHLITARMVYMHHCLMALRWQRMCAIFYVHYTTYLPPMGSPYSSELIWYFYVHCNLALLGSEAQESLCEICPTSLATFLGFLRFFMDLLVQDSIWIYLFFMAIWTYLLSLFWEGGSLHYSLHCDSTTLLNQAPSPKGSAGVVCWLGCSLLEVVTTSNYSNIREGSSSF